MIILHLQNEYKGLKSTTFLSVDEINALLQFLISEGTRGLLNNLWVAETPTMPAPEDFVRTIGDKIDSNCLKFSPAIKNAYVDKDGYYSMYHDFELDDERRKLLKSYYFGRFGEVFKENAPYGIDNYNAMAYNDLTIYRGERVIFESMTHEYYAAADLDGLEEKFISFGDMPERNAEIIRKLNYAAPPNFLVGAKATVTLKDGGLEVLTADGIQVTFEFSADNYELRQNTGYLGGEPKYIDGEVKLIGANPCEFISGNAYVIDDLIYNADVQGSRELNPEPPCTFCDIYLELTDGNGRHCDVEISSKYVHVKVNA